MRRALIGALAALAFAVGPSPVRADPASALTFFRNPDLQAVKFSPSGRWLALTAAVKGGRIVLAILDSADETSKPRIAASFSDADIGRFEWVNDDRLVFNLVDRDADRASDRFGPGLYVVDREGSNPRNLVLTSAPLVTAPGGRALAPNHQLLDTVFDGGDDVIVGEFKITTAGELDSIVPKRLNVVTGRAAPIAPGAPPDIKGWLFDHAGKPRVAWSRANGEHQIWRLDDAGTWQSIARSHGVTASMAPLALDAEGVLYLSTSSVDGYAVVRRFDVATGRPESDTVVSAPGFDVGGKAIVDRESGRVVGIRYLAEAETTTWLDPQYEALQAMVDERFARQKNTLWCRRCASDGLVLVHSYSDQDPGRWWLYRAASRRWQSIGRVRGDVDPATMAQVEFVRAKARDGEDLPLWITAPPGKSGARLPAVVLVHGGPWVRGGSLRWNPDAQFLASRGYLVVEPEFRGSTGFGASHFKKGFRQWGLAMQDDVADAARWAIDRGLADPARICLAGASYGGYATLMGLVRNPEIFRCGVAWVAVTDPRLLFKDDRLSDMSAEARAYSLPVLIGDPVADAAQLKEAAPVEHAREIKAPLLMAFGGEDRRVPLEHGTRMRDALRAAGAEPEFVVYDGEGHGWFKVENRVDWWNRVERFLAKSLH